MSKGFFLRLAAGNIRKHRRIYYPYILTAVLTVMMLYIISSLASNTALRAESLIFTLGLGKWVTTIFTVVFLFYTNSFLMKRRKMEFGLLNILGMEKKHISLVVGCETVTILALSLAVGLGLGILLDKLLYMILIKMLNGVTGGLNFYVSLPAAEFAAGIVSATFLLILLNSIRQIHLSKPIELLRGGQVGEKEPKAKWAIAVLGLLCLGGGYYISIRVTNALASLMLFFVAVVLVILGTYLLYTSGSVALLKWMRRRKGYYYQPSHFINVSGMIYRMKQNAVGLANISILCTMVLVIVFSTFSLWFGMEDILLIRSPFDVCVTMNEPERREELYSLVNSTVQARGLEAKNQRDYAYLSFGAFHKGDVYITDMGEELDVLGDGLVSFYALTLADYNRLTGGHESLEPNQIILGTPEGKATEETLSIFDRHYQVKGFFPGESVQNDLANCQAYLVKWLVVADQAELDALDARQREAYGKNASTLKYYICFDLSKGGDQAVTACADDIVQAFKAHEVSYNYVDGRPEMRVQLRELYGSLLFIGLFLGALFTMAMILIVYYKQISEGYEDKERYRIMRQVGLSRAEIKRSISAQVLIVFFLPLITAGVHTVFSFPSITHMFSALNMTNIPLMRLCLAGSFVLFAALYAVVYLLTAKVYYKIVS